MRIMVDLYSNFVFLTNNPYYKFLGSIIFFIYCCSINCAIINPIIALLELFNRLTKVLKCLTTVRGYASTSPAIKCISKTRMNTNSS